MKTNPNFPLSSTASHMVMGNLQQKYKQSISQCFGNMTTDQEIII